MGTRWKSAQSCLTGAMTQDFSQHAIDGRHALLHLRAVLTSYLAMLQVGSQKSIW